MKKQQLHAKINRIIEIEGKKFRYFSGTSYLGIAQDSVFLENLAEEILRLGSTFGQSRKNTFQLQVFEDFELYFAEQAGADHALVFSSGYLAGIAASTRLVQQVDSVWVAPDAHPATIPIGCQPSTLATFTNWKNFCLEQLNKKPAQKILLCGNSVDALGIEIHDYSWVPDLARDHEVWLLIDDSHAFGTLGKGIFGTYSQWDHPSIQLLVCGSLGKGLGLPAGIVLCPDSAYDPIKTLPLFAGASPGSPAHLQAFLNLQPRYAQACERLKELTHYFFEQLQETSQLVGSPRFPVFRYTEDSWVDRLEASGILTSSFPYPHPNSPTINRIVLSAFHKKEDIDYLVDCLEKLT